MTDEADKRLFAQLLSNEIRNLSSEIAYEMILNAEEHSPSSLGIEQYLERALNAALLNWELQYATPYQVPERQVRAAPDRSETVTAMFPVASFLKSTVSVFDGRKVVTLPLHEIAIKEHAEGRLTFVIHKDTARKHGWL